MLEICQNAAESTDITTDHRGHDGSSWSRRTVMDSVVPYLMQFLLLLSSLPSTAGMTDHHRHNGPSRVSVPKHLNSWNMGTGTTSLIFMTKPQDGSSWLRRSVTLFVTPHLFILPYLPSATALCCHLRTVTSSVGALFCISSLKNLRIHLWTDFLQIRRNLYKN